MRPRWNMWKNRMNKSSKQGHANKKYVRNIGQEKKLVLRNQRVFPEAMEDD